MAEPRTALGIEPNSPVSGTGTPHFSERRTHGARVGPKGEPELSRQWRIQSMRLEDRDYTEDKLVRAVESIDPDEKWLETDEAGSRDEDEN